MSKLRSLYEDLDFMRGNILVLTVTRVLGMFCRSMAFPYASLYILVLGGSSSQIGLINSMRPVGALLILPLAGYLADRIGRTRLIVLGGCLSGLIYIMYALAPDWKILALGALLQGLIVFHFPATSAIIADSLPPEKRGKGIATMNTIAGTLAVFSPYAAGVMLDLYGVNAGMRYLYGILAVAYLSSAAINLLYLKETHKERANSVTSDLRQIFKDAYCEALPMLRQLPLTLQALTAIIVLGFVSNGIAAPFWVVYAVESIGLSSVEWGLILLFEIVFRNLMYIPAGIFVDRYGRRRPIQISLLIALVVLPLFPLSSSFLEVLIIRLSLALSTALFIPASSALLADMVPRKMRGRVTSALGRGTMMLGAVSGGTGGPGMGFVMAVPLIFASLSGGHLYTYNQILPWIFASIAMLVSVIVSVLFVREPEEAEV